MPMRSRIKFKVCLLHNTDNGRQVQQITGLAMACRPSVDFCGYWQRARQTT